MSGGVVRFLTIQFVSWRVEEFATTMMIIQVDTLTPSGLTRFLRRNGEDPDRRKVPNSFTKSRLLLANSSIGPSYFVLLEVSFSVAREGRSQLWQRRESRNAEPRPPSEKTPAGCVPMWRQRLKRLGRTARWDCLSISEESWFWEAHLTLAGAFRH